MAENTIHHRGAMHRFTKVARAWVVLAALAVLGLALPAGPARAFTAPQIAVDPNGNAAIVYQSFIERIPTYAFDVARWREAATGTFVPVLTKPADTIATNSTLANRPKIVIGPTGVTTYIWAAVADGQYSMWMKQRRPDGRYTNQYKLTFRDPLTGALHDGLETQVDRDEFGDDPLFGRVAIAPSGEVTISWRRFNGRSWIVVARQISPEGLLGPGYTISATTGDASEPEVAVGPSEIASLVWINTDPTSKEMSILTRRIMANGTATAIVRLSGTDGQALDPHVAVGRTYETFVWSLFDGNDAKIQTVRRVLGTGALTPVVTLSPAAGRSRNPRVTVDPSGNEVFIWRHRVGTVLTFNVEGARRTLSGVVGKVIELGPFTADTDDMRVDVDSLGNATAIWQSDDGKNFVATRTWAASGALSPITRLSPLGRRAGAPQLSIDEATRRVFLIWECEASIHFTIRSVDGKFDPVTLLAGDRDTLTKPRQALTVMTTAR